MTEKYTSDQQQITKLLAELSLQLNNFSMAVDEVVSSIYDSAMKFPPDVERRPVEFSADDLVDKLHKSRIRLDRKDIKHLKDLFEDIDKMKENDYIEDSEDIDLDE
tara:strand:- start:633 stop:950 length:318 start_codon:yes stop_codon:yes gene_type:complete